MFCDDMAVVDRVMLKGMCIVVTEALQRQTLEQLHVNYMEIKKSKFLVQESIYWTGTIMILKTT